MNEAINIALIVAVAKNGVIGIENRLPWHLPADLKHFRQTTMGKPIIMGRKTFDSIGKALPGRTNIVVSRTQQVLPEGVLSVNSVEEAIRRATVIAKQHAVHEVMVIGGEQIYQASMPFATKLYLTQVDVEPQGDAWFRYNASQWQLKQCQSFAATIDNPYNYHFCEYERNQ